MKSCDDLFDDAKTIQLRAEELHQCKEKIEELERKLDRAIEQRNIYHSICDSEGFGVWPIEKLNKQIEETK